MAVYTTDGFGEQGAGRGGAAVEEASRDIVVGGEVDGLGNRDAEGGAAILQLMTSSFADARGCRIASSDKAGPDFSLEYLLAGTAGTRRHREFTQVDGRATGDEGEGK